MRDDCLVEVAAPFPPPRFDAREEVVEAGSPASAFSVEATETSFCRAS